MEQILSIANKSIDISCDLSFILTHWSMHSGVMLMEI